jgi:hypothetical protein
MQLVRFPLLSKEGWPGYEFKEIQKTCFLAGVVYSGKSKNFGPVNVEKKKMCQMILKRIS